jgi:hypothetical protein
MKPLTAILCLALAGCNPPRAIVVAPIAPAVSEARGKVQATSAATTRTQRGATETAQRVGAVREGIDEAINHAEAMQARKPTESQEYHEWQNQWKLLTEIRTRNLFAEASAQSTAAQSAEAQTLADAASTSLGALDDHAKATDKNTSAITTENAKLQQDAGTWRGIKGAAKTLIILIIAAALLIFAFLAFKKGIIG